MCLNRNGLFGLSLFLLAGCSAGFLGLAPIGDRKEYIQARNAYQQENYQEAVTQLSNYIYKTKNVSRREARAYRLLGDSYKKLGNSGRALEVYSEALEFYPNNVALLVKAAQLYQENGLTTRSIELYEHALQEDPDNTAALAGQAANYTTLGFYSKARSFYDQFFSLTPQVTPYYRALYASTFLRQRNYEQAFIHITQALAQDNTNPDFWRLSAEARRGLNMPEEALIDLETALTLSPERTDFLAYKALWLLEEKNYEASLQTAEKILEKDPNYTLAWLVKALNWQKLGKTEQARSLFAQIAKKTPTTFVGQVSQALLNQ